jgi:hypothetical protein
MFIYFWFSVNLKKSVLFYVVLRKCLL